MQLIRIVVAAAALTVSCDNGPTEPELGTFSATLRGARAERLSGSSYIARVFSEAWPGPRLSIVMSGSAIHPGKPIVIDCPEEELVRTGTYPLQETLSACRAAYRLVGASPDQPPVEEVVGRQGSVVINKITSTFVSGVFEFSGPLKVNGIESGSVTLMGEFNARRLQQ